MFDIYPLKFEPILKTVIWGGSRIKRLKNLPNAGDNIGESWELSGVPGRESIVNNGIYAGRNIKSLLSEFGKDIVGEFVYSQFGNTFPLLVKFIDAAKDLSIQVHPGDDIAKQMHDSFGKTELWYILNAEKGAVLYSGFSVKTNEIEFRKQIESGNVMSHLNRFYPQKGDIFFLPAGRVHGIGAGNFLIEIQQASDVTYRIYDFDRVDKDGKKRELHTDMALNAIDYDEYHDYKNHLELEQEGEVLIKKCDKFTSSLLRIERPTTLPIKSTGSFRILICYHGNAELIYGREKRTEYLSSCETVLLPYSMENIEIRPMGKDVEFVSVVVE